MRLRFFRRVGRFVRRAAPVLRSIARVAAPIVGTAMVIVALRRQSRRPTQGIPLNQPNEPRDNS